MGIETNLNQSPYFDDFDETKNFHRVLFRPGYAVQARELTQLQTILQNQVERFANKVVYDGKVVSGVNLKVETIDYVKLRDKDANNRVLLLGDFFESGVVANAVVVGQTSGMTAQLIDAKEGSEAASPDYLSIFVKYTNSGANNTTKSFLDNEVLAIRRRANNEFLVAANTITSSATGLGLRATVGSGIVYHKGHFVRVEPQGVIVEKYATNPSKKVGFETRETLIDSNQDSSLLDNASGATNFSAPGANRLKLTPTLAVRDLNAANSTTFFAVANIEEGKIVQKVNDELAGVNALVAERIFETNGNFAIEPFNIRIRENLKRSDNLGRYEDGDSQKLVAEIEPAIGYVGGNRISLENTVFRDVDKATDFEVKDARILGQAFGHYVICDEVVGTWDFQGLRTVSLRDAEQNGISGKNYGTQSAQGSEIGTAKIRGIQWDSGTMGTASGRFRVYLFDIQMNTDKSFTDVAGIYIDNTGTKSMANVLTVNGTKLQEPGLNSLVFPFTQSGTKTLRDADNNVDTQFVFRTEKSVNFDTAGTATVTANTAHAGGTETLNDTGNPLSNSDERNIIVVSRSATTTEPHTGYISTISGNTVTGVGTAFDTTYQVGDLIQIDDGGNTYIEIVSEITNSTTIKTVDTFSVSKSGQTLAHRTSFPTGYIFDLSSNGTITSTSSQHQIELGQANLTSSFSASVYFNVLRSDANPTLKTVFKDRYVHIDTSTHSANSVGPWSLGVSDAYKLVAVYKGGNTSVTTSDADVTSHFEIDSGMKDAYYDTASLRQKSTSTLDLTNSGLLVKFNYFGRDRSAGIGFLSVDSYPIDDVSTANTTAIRTEEIPFFVSPTSGRQIDLRDAIDMRPIKSNTVTPSTTGTAAAAPTNPSASSTFNIDSDGAYMPTPDENFQADVQFYLPRRDRVVLTKEGAVEVIKGIPSLSPNAPDPRAGSMTLATLDIPVYPSLSPFVARNANRQKYAVRLTLENNRRYTMSDLRAVENRVKNLEYYSSLNALEASAKNKQIFSDTGLDRFKNGFLVDNFDGHNIADTRKVGYRAAIDRNNTQLRPTFNRADVSLSKDVSFTSSNITKTGSLVTLAYTNVSLLDQRFGSKLRNPVQELTFNWQGEVILNPSMDNTPDTTTLPDIQVDFDGMYNAIEEIANRTGITGIDWGNWRTTSSTTNRNVAVAGRTTTTTTTTQTNQIRTGIQTSISPSTETFSIGNFVENVAVRDFMRSRLVQFTGTRMKPNTRVYPYFDDELVTGYCTPANSSFANTASEGSVLTTDSSGNVYGVFRIPNDDALKFRVGTKRFTLKDVANTQTQSALITTSAHGDYTSIGLDITQRGSSVNMVVPQIARDRVSDNRTLTNTTVRRVRQDDGDGGGDNGGSGGSDPLAQTFSINTDNAEGCFITKLDLYFGRKSSTYPITVQIREVENGIPTQTIVPFGSKTLAPSEVNVNSVSAQTATSFTFDSPVFLTNGREYCFVVKPAGNNDEYALWVGELGGTDVDTNELIHKQPAAGIMLSSANDKTWSPIQAEDIKFNLYRAEFTTSAGTLYVENDDLDFFTYETINGQFNVGEKVTNGAGASGFVKFIDRSNQKIHIESSTGGFGSSNTITGAVSGATADLSSIDNPVLNTLVPKIPELTFANTATSWSVRTTSTSGVINTSYQSIDLGVENDFLDGEKKVYSKTNESLLSAVDGSQKSLVLKGTFSTTDTRVSPVIDTTRMNGIVIENVINNTLDREWLEIGDASMRYITRPVELTDGNEAEDLKVFVTAYKPQGTNVAVYARILNPEDAEGIDDKDFTPLTQITSSNVYSDSVDTSDFREFEFGFSANTDGQGFLTTANSHARLNSSNNEVVAYRSNDGSIHHTFKTFAIKIVMTSTGTNIIPLARDMRVIALQK